MTFGHLHDSPDAPVYDATATCISTRSCSIPHAHIGGAEKEKEVEGRTERPPKESKAQGLSTHTMSARPNAEQLKRKEPVYMPGRVHAYLPVCIHAYVRKGTREDPVRGKRVKHMFACLFGMWLHVKVCIYTCGTGRAPERLSRPQFKEIRRLEALLEASAKYLGDPWSLVKPPRV